MHTSEEQWLPVVGYEGLYEVSDRGGMRVLSPRWPQRFSTPDHRLSQTTTRSGHLQVTLRRGKVKRSHLVHVLVLSAFGCLRPEESIECRHLDGNPSNNVVSNLKWGSRSENMLDRIAHGTHHRTRVTECPKGHEYNEKNTRYWTIDGRIRRRCKVCEARRSRESRWRKEALASSAA